jgi:hypothetical protein
LLLRLPPPLLLLFLLLVSSSNKTLATRPFASIRWFSCTLLLKIGLQVSHGTINSLSSPAVLFLLQSNIRLLLRPQEGRVPLPSFWCSTSSSSSCCCLCPCSRSSVDCRALSETPQSSSTYNHHPNTLFQNVTISQERTHKARRKPPEFRRLQDR